jgi:hypothetical protein
MREMYGETADDTVHRRRHYASRRAGIELFIQSYLLIFTGTGRGGLGRLAVVRASTEASLLLQVAAVDNLASVSLAIYGHVLVPDWKHVADRIAERQPICSRLLADCRPSTVHTTANVYSQYSVC